MNRLTMTTQFLCRFPKHQQCQNAKFLYGICVVILISSQIRCFFFCSCTTFICIYSSIFLPTDSNIVRRFIFAWHILYWKKSTSTGEKKGQWSEIYFWWRWKCLQHSWQCIFIIENECILQNSNNTNSDSLSANTIFE